MDDMLFMGESNSRIKSFVFDDGKVIKKQNLTHVALFKQSNDDESINFLLSYVCKDKKDLRPLSNQLFAMSNILKLIDKFDVTFEDAFKLHVQQLKTMKNIKNKYLKEKKND